MNKLVAVMFETDLTPEQLHEKLCLCIYEDNKEAGSDLSLKVIHMALAKECDGTELRKRILGYMKDWKDIEDVYDPSLMEPERLEEQQQYAAQLRRDILALETGVQL